MTNTMIGFWVLLPYLPADNLFIEDKKEAIIHQIEVEITEISELDPQMLVSPSQNNRYYLIEQLPTKVRGSNSGY